MTPTARKAVKIAAFRHRGGWHALQRECRSACDSGRQPRGLERVHDVWVFRAAAIPNLRCPERESRRGLQRGFQLLRPFCDVKRMAPVDIRAPPVSYFALQWRCHSSAVKPRGRRSRYLHCKSDPFARIACRLRVGRHESQRHSACVGPRVPHPQGLLSLDLVASAWTDGLAPVLETGLHEIPAHFGIPR